MSKRDCFHADDCEVCRANANALDYWHDTAKTLEQKLGVERREQDRLRSQLAALTPKPERFDAETVAKATCYSLMASLPAAEREVADALRAAYAQGWKDATSLDEENHRAAWAEADRLRGEVTALREALSNAIEAIRLGLIEGECQEVDSENPEPCGTWHDTANEILRQCRAALSASPPEPAGFGDLTVTPEEAAQILALVREPPDPPPLLVEVLRRHARREPKPEQPKPDAGPCAVCSGTGTSFFNAEVADCPDCSGTGREPGGAK